MNVKTGSILFFALAPMALAHAAANDSTGRALASSGSPFVGHQKIYVVMLVCLTILAGLFLYLFFTDRRLSKLEKRFKK